MTTTTVIDTAKAKLAEFGYAPHEAAAIIDRIIHDKDCFLSMDERLAKIAKGRAPRFEDVPPEIVARVARDHHVWLNAFSCINPSDEFLTEVGRIVLDRLSVAKFTDSLGISPMAVFSINKS